MPSVRLAPQVQEVQEVQELQHQVQPTALPPWALVATQLRMLASLLLVLPALLAILVLQVVVALRQPLPPPLLALPF